MAAEDGPEHAGNVDDKAYCEDEDNVEAYVEIGEGDDLW